MQLHEQRFRHFAGDEVHFRLRRDGLILRDGESPRRRNSWRGMETGARPARAPDDAAISSERESREEPVDLEQEETSLKKDVCLELLGYQTSLAQLPESSKVDADDYNIRAKMSAARSMAPPGPILARTSASPVFALRARGLRFKQLPHFSFHGLGRERVLDQLRHHAPARNQVHHADKRRADHAPQNGRRDCGLPGKRRPSACPAAPPRPWPSRWPRWRNRPPPARRRWRLRRASVRAPAGDRARTVPL